MKKLLISPMYGMGDTLLTTPAIRLLKENRPDFFIECITFQKTSYELLLGNTFIDNLIFYPFLNKNKLESLIYILKNIVGKYEAVINFYPSNRMEYNLFSFLTLAKDRIGHTYLRSNFSQLNWLKNKTIKEDFNIHCVQENIRLLEFFDIKIEKIPPMEIYLKDEEIINGKNYIAKVSNKSKRIGIHTGTSSFKNHIHRRWPKEKFLEVINSLKEFDFFLFGTKEEEEENKFIQEMSLHKNVYLIENKNIRDVAGIIKNLDLFISNDSGLMHLAAATGVPIVAIFGPTNPNWVRPWGVKYKIIRNGLTCSPCFYYSPKPLKCYISEKFKCIKNIESNLVINAVLELLG